ncbi:MAG TPA: hypothetical protein ENL40_09205 [Thermococcus litoralis]|uniref:Uncharacterized protein n=1 Tax=Thermococcus litoralis TaxID=2265 RepID=A0A7C5NTW9_THELI|nr:hypothetical protein [Thermococcus litoralis]
MRIEVPYLVFEVRGRRFMLDAYFSRKVEKVEHISVLIRKFDSNFPKEAENPLPKLINEETIGEFLTTAFEKIYELSGRTLDERLRHMQKWNVLRILGIPTGFRRHKEKDEVLAKENREALLALSLLQEVLGVKSPAELRDIKLRPVEWRYYTIEVKGDEIYNKKGKKDPVYTELLKRDSSFKQALYALEYSQQAT